jgi:excisionase family DNA binding protein
MATFQIQLAITLGEDAARVLAELLGPRLKQVMFPSSNFDEKREARLRSSQNALFCGQKPPEDQGLLIDSREASKLLKVSAGTLSKMCRSGQMPPPIRIGRAVRWSFEGLKQWIAAGCPAVGADN